MESAKRQRTEILASSPGPEQASLFSAEVLSDAGCRRLESEYASAEPFSHCVLSPLFADPQKLQTVGEEILEHLEAKYKETDLFKVRVISQQCTE
eukprot:SAG31_NODE_1875_length_7019_cov_39.090896_8_plen_95_part_00